MSTIQDINPNKGISFYGNKTTVSDDPELIALAKQLNNQRMCLVSETITEYVNLKPEYGRILLAYVESGSWLNVFECNLQSLCCDREGRNLLTGCMDINQFDSFLNEIIETDSAVTQVLNDLKVVTKEWHSIGVEEVFFDGYELNT